MRKRLIIVFLVPMTVILLALAGAYAWSVARSIQQEVSNQQLGDLSYFLTGARQALRAGAPDVIEGELRRYSELYDAEVAVFDRSGALWASGGLEPGELGEEATAQLGLALSGRRSEPVQTVLPWSLGETTVVEPVFDDGIVIGAVVISASAEQPRSEILTHWLALIAVCIAIVALLVLAVFRLASWVLQPMHRLDEAMAAIEHGEMNARISDDTGPPETRSMTRIFNQMAEEIERVISRQQEFAMNASHELRNPLGALLMRVEYLATGLDESWDDDVEKTREEGRRMSRILDTLLGMARAGRADSVFAVVDLVDVVTARVAAWRHVARERGVRIAVSAPAAAPALTDRTAVESAFDAVIDNALKFAPRGTEVDVTVAVPGEECEIAVRDRGRGLEPEELERATRRFWRSARDQNVPGSGLGLAIATDLMHALGGRIEVSAPGGGGLRVALHLPAGEV
ncbi:ATP-binding protein [Leucobacter ruminantium]|uniref:histidine kinase n=1 Tax=Leucobacter ruminantium TaxID=1289170 RepID=A0A939RZ38_9MICO|nr:HAMP domain-containing histidine kinase [Leucobacter ruminantium]